MNGAIMQKQTAVTPKIRREQRARQSGWMGGADQEDTGRDEEIGWEIRVAKSRVVLVQV